MASVSNANGVFTGLSALYVIPGGFNENFAVPTTGSGSAATPNIVEVPVAEDGGFTYTGGTPNVDRYRVHGLTAPWAIRMTPGDSETNLFIPQVTEALLELFGFTVESQSSTAIAGSNWSGMRFRETSVAVEVGIAAINDTDDQMFAIKKAKLMAALTFDEANTAKPIGITLSGANSAGGEDDAMGIFTKVTV